MDPGQFDFVLPENLIALRPASPRDDARMLVVFPDGSLEQAGVRDLPRYLRAGDAMVVNNSKVFPARLRGHRLARDGSGDAGPAIEVLLFTRDSSRSFQAFVRPARKLEPGDWLAFGGGLQASVLARGEAGVAVLEFAVEGAALDALIASEGETPLPPYIASKRKADEADISDYQTLFAQVEGSVAAPTAGLHFTPTLLEALAQKGVSREHLTLHVGPGTFQPVSASDTSLHRMHAEWAELSPGTAGRLNAVKDAGGRILAVGTTALRTLESAARADGRIGSFRGHTDIFMIPGHKFHTADILLTNFHLPRSTLFMLACAFSGTAVMKRAYAQAIAMAYRFYSYGDACLLFRSSP